MEELNELSNNKSKTVIQQKDLLYPFAVILFIMSFFDLTGALTILSVLTAIIAEVFEITSDSMVTIINLAINIVAQISSIAIFMVLNRGNRVEPEEKSMPKGNHFLLTYLVYSLLIVFTFVVAFIDSFLESLDLPDKSPYEAIEPTLDLLGDPLFYILFFGTLVFGAAIWEELVFRRTFIPFLERRGIGTFWVLLISSLLFSLMHTPQDLLSGSVRFAIVHFFSTFAGGFALGFLYMRTRNILWPIILHGLVNGVAGVSMIGLVRYDELGDISIIALGGMWVLTALAVGGGTVLYVVIQAIRYRSSPTPPAWLRILTDFNIRPSRLLPVALIALGFVGIEGGIPIIIDLLFNLLGEPSQEIEILQYFIEMIYLTLLIIILGFFIYKKTGPLKEADWVSDLTFPDTKVPSYSYGYPAPATRSQNFCGSCGRESVPNTQFCVYCGVKTTKICGSCGRDIISNTQFCVYCGVEN